MGTRLITRSEHTIVRIVEMCARATIWNKTGHLKIACRDRSAELRAMDDVDFVLATGDNTGFLIADEVDTW